MASGEDNDVVIFPDTENHVAAATEASSVIGSATVQTAGVDTAVDEVRLITMINDDNNNDHNDDRAKECSEQNDIEMIANGVADVE